MLLIALMLIVTMAIISNTTSRIHPDEFDHIEAARFYRESWLPPAVGDPRTLDTYSVYGMSYLNEWDVVYILAGKFALLIQPIVQNEIYAFRFFNVCLFLLLVYMAWVRRDEILIFSILLISPQIWYVFSYFNADAFALFLSILAAQELTSSSSAFNDRTRSVVARYLRVGIYVGLIILSKRTFWMFGVFTLCYIAAVEIWGSDKRRWHRLLAQAGTLAVFIGVVALPRIAYDIYVNGPPPQKAEEIIATATLLADTGFKPAQLATNPYTLGRLKSRGTTLWQMVRTMRWFQLSAMSAFGVYHYMALFGAEKVYVLAGTCVGLLAGALVFLIALKGSAEDNIIMAFAVVCCMSVVGLSLYHSWVNDFQAQGRYLFAIFPITGVLLMRAKTLLHRGFVSGIVGAGFLLSTYSFVFVGLHQIPKYWEHVETPDSPGFRLEREWKQRLH
ncbi:MAG: hypothetical protein WKH97_16710 [Casimicrobiaceae bacterium]